MYHKFKFLVRGEFIMQNLKVKNYEIVKKITTK